MIYESKACPRHRSGNGKGEKIFDALEWLAAMSSAFILSPVEEQRKEANDYDGRITEKKDFR